MRTASTVIAGMLLAVLGWRVFGTAGDGADARGTTPPLLERPAPPAALAESPPVRPTATPDAPSDHAGGAAAVPIDADGELAATHETLTFFRSFQGGATGIDAPTLRARILEALETRLEGAALERATRVLDAYLAYREASARQVSTVDPTDLSADAYRARVDELAALRRSHLGEDAAQALFGREEARQRDAIERYRIARDPALDDDQRVAALRQLEAHEDPELVAQRRAARAPTRLHREVESLRADGAGDAEVHAHRVQAFGEEAADRLAALDEERRVFAERYERYRTELAAAPAAVDEIRARHFAPAELARIEALDRAAREP